MSNRLAEGLDGRADWSQCAAIVESFFALDTTDSHKLFCTKAEGVLEHIAGRLEIRSWESIRERIAPALAEQRRRNEQLQREQRGREIHGTRLPKVRKLRKMILLLDELLTCQPTINEQGPQAIAFIRTMTRDDSRFADCATFMQYIAQANEIIGQTPAEPSESQPQINQTNVVELFKPSKPR